MNRKTILIIIFIFGVSSGFLVSNSQKSINQATADDLAMDEQEATIRAIKNVIPAVVSIIVYDYDDFYAIDSPSGIKEVQKIRKEKIKGTGFLITSDGYIITNRHVVSAADEESGEFRVILNSGKQYYAQLIGKDPLNDLAVIKIFDKDLPYVELGDSNNLEIGTTVIAIGNALGRYENSATKGIVSGLGRSLVANDVTSGGSETLDNVIQTDANINRGNSGGPLIDLGGRVVGVNVAVDQAGSAVGFAIPVNDARGIINSIREENRIVRPILGVRYQMITPEIAYDFNLPRDTGAWLSTNEDNKPAVIPNYPADLGGVEDGDIIFEINAIKIEGSNTLSSIVQEYRPGDKIGLKIQRGEKTVIKIVTLGEY